VWLAVDVMVEVGVIWLGRLLGLEEGCVASSGCDLEVGVIWLGRLLGLEGG
jgi:hypothetical protein